MHMQYFDSSHRINCNRDKDLSSVVSIPNGESNIMITYTHYWLVSRTCSVTISHLSEISPQEIYLMLTAGNYAMAITILLLAD